MALADGWYRRRVLAVKIFNITLIGVNARTGKKLLFTVVLYALLWVLREAALWLTRRYMPGEMQGARRFWSRQGIQIASAIVLVLGTFSIWVDAGTNLTTGLGLLSAGLAFALQQVITSLAAYFVILRGDMFNVGDRITLGLVRGDVVRLGFIKTTVMEIGVPASMQDSGSTEVSWIHSRQYTGRLVTVTNGTIFTDPVFNYSLDFPYVWDEITVPITYDADAARAEEILLGAARNNAVPAAAMSAQAIADMRRHYAVAAADLEPHVYFRITDNWLELSLRFVVPDRGIRAIKDAISRQILVGFADAGIGVASATYDIVGLPPVQLTSPVDSTETDQRDG